MGKTILVVDDNTISREGMAVVLRHNGFTVLTATDGNQALDLLRTSPAPDLILLDMVMPAHRCDGWGFLEQRSRNPAMAVVPVIVTTGLGISSFEWAISLGAAGYLRKPIELEPLVAEIERCLPG